MHPFLRLASKRQKPKVELVDLRSDTTDLTVYTFAKLNINLGSVASIAGEAYGANPHCRSPSRAALLMFINAKDALTVFTVLTAALGGVNGTILTNINAGVLAGVAAVMWTTDQLAAIAGTDAVITFSEAITGCSVSLIKISNIGVVQNVVAFNLTGTGVIGEGFDITIGQTEQGALLVCGSVTDGIENFSIGNDGAGALLDPSEPWQVLYAENNGEFSYAAAWTYSPQYNADNSHAAIGSPSWDGGSTGVALSIGFV